MAAINAKKVQAANDAAIAEASAPAPGPLTGFLGNFFG